MAPTGTRQVVGGGDLRAGAGEIEMQQPVIDGELRLNAHRQGRVVVVIEVVRELVGTVRQGAECIAGLGGRIRDDLGGRGLKRGPAVLLDNSGDAARPDPQSCHHGAQVAEIFFRCPAVGCDDGQDIAVENAAPYQLQGRDHQPFLIDVMITGRNARWHPTADICGMDERPPEADDVSAVEIGLQQVNVRQVRREAMRHVGMVSDDDVTRLQPRNDGNGLARVIVDHVRDAEIALWVSEGFAGKIHQRGAEIFSFLHIDGAAGAL